MYIVVGSSTTAERLRKAIENITGFPSDVVHTPQPIRRGGCSYSVRTDDRAINMVKKIAYEKGISYKKIYTVSKQQGECVYHAIS